MVRFEVLSFNKQRSKIEHQREHVAELQRFVSQNLHFA